MRRIHYWSGLTITIFIALHLFNHVYSLAGVGAHLEMMDNLRIFYRNVWVESVLMIAISIQVVSGIKLFLHRRKTAKGFFEKVQIWSGLYLAFFFVFHLTAVFFGRWVLDLDTNFYFGAAGINFFPFYLFFVPYYGAAILSFFGHIAAIHSKKMRRNLLGLGPQKQSYGILLLGLLFVVLTFYGLTNGFTGIDLPEEYQVMIGGS